MNTFNTIDTLAGYYSALSNASYTEFLLLNSGTIPFIIRTVPILSTLIARSIKGDMSVQMSS